MTKICLWHFHGGGLLCEHGLMSRCLQYYFALHGCKYCKHPLKLPWALNWKCVKRGGGLLHELYTLLGFVCDISMGVGSYVSMGSWADVYSTILHRMDVNTVNIPSSTHGPLTGNVLKEGVDTYTNYTHDKDLFVTFPWGGLISEHGLLSVWLKYSFELHACKYRKHPLKCPWALNWKRVKRGGWLLCGVSIYILGPTFFPFWRKAHGRLEYREKREENGQDALEKRGVRGETWRT